MVIHSNCVTKMCYHLFSNLYKTLFTALVLDKESESTSSQLSYFKRKSLNRRFGVLNGLVSPVPSFRGKSVEVVRVLVQGKGWVIGRRFEYK